MPLRKFNRKGDFPMLVGDGAACISSAQKGLQSLGYSKPTPPHRMQRLGPKVLSARARLVREHCSHHDLHVLIPGTANPSQVDWTDLSPCGQFRSMLWGSLITQLIIPSLSGA